MGDRGPMLFYARSAGMVKTARRATEGDFLPLSPYFSLNLLRTQPPGSGSRNAEPTLPHLSPRTQCRNS